MRKLLSVIFLSASGLLVSGIAFAGIPQPDSYDLYSCEGTATFEDGYAADVALVDGWEGHTFQAEDDDTSWCKGNKDDGFACTGSGNLITSRINDDMVVKAFFNSIDEESLSLTGGTDPTFAVVHAGIFLPGNCAESFKCDFDEDGGTPDVDCFDSGYGNGPGPGDVFNNREDSCADAATNTGEGMFAAAYNPEDMTPAGTPFSDGRSKSGNSKHKNWAMYVELTASCAGNQSVDANAPAPACDASIETDAVADGGDYPADWINAGTVTFTPNTTNCVQTVRCLNNPDPTNCVDT